MKKAVFSLILLLVCSPWSVMVWAADKKADPAQPLPIKYPVEIKVDNEELKKMLEEHLPLITQQQEEELDREQMDFLAEEAPEQVLTMLKTKGYFNAKTEITRTEQGYLIHVTPNQQTTISNVNVAITGDILQDADLGKYYRSAMENWALPVGEVFNQDNWSSSKTSVLSAVKRKKYPLAQFSHTQATINPNTRTADVSVNVDSKQPIYFGELEITGTQRYPERVVRGLARFQAGSPYDLDQLLDYQQALEQDSHYSGASVQADFDRLVGDRVPVKVHVSEVKRHKAEWGLRYDSEYGIGGRVAYDYYNLFNKGYVGSAVMDMDKYETTAALGISQPRNSKGRYWTTNTAYNRSTVQNLEKKVLSTGWWMVRDRNNIESRVGIEYVSESASIPSANMKLGHSYATMLTASWKKQNIESQMRPENGYYLDGKIGGTLGSLLSSSAMYRVNTRAGYYFTPENKQLGTWVMRGQIGYVHSKNRTDVPSSLMFRTGGATTVRGYELDSIGRAGPASSVLADRAIAVASLEYQYPITKSFSAALFHDMGDVSDRFQNMTMKHGSGVGVRWFSPVAPFSFDIAYGHQDKKIRWHISLGTRF